MHPEDTPDAPPTEGQTIPPEEQIIPTAGLVQEDEQTQGSEQGQGDEQAQGMADKVKEAAPESAGAAAQQAQSLAQERPVPIALAGAFIAGVVVGRIASRR
jgi:F0F1-type ATP synthase assembly protein I